MITLATEMGRDWENVEKRKLFVVYLSGKALSWD